MRSNLRQKCLKVAQVKSIYVWNKVTVCVLVPTTAISISHPPPLINPMFINWHVRGAIHHGWWNIEMATDGEGFLEMPFFPWNQGVPNVRFEVRFVLQCRPLTVTNTDSLKKKVSRLCLASNILQYVFSQNGYINQNLHSLFHCINQNETSCISLVFSTMRSSSCITPDISRKHRFLSRQ